MPQNLFWTRLIYLMGDLAFSQPVHSLATSLATNWANHPTKNVYRYTLTFRNPFPGTELHQIPGHHFIELLFLFGTLQERYHMRQQIALSEEFMHRWIAFGRGEEPWEKFEAAGNIMVISGREGWVCKTREQDERESLDAEEGIRRYAGWENIADVMKNLKEDRGAVGASTAMMAWGPWGLP
jgi:carboxylesterase type B